MKLRSITHLNFLAYSLLLFNALARFVTASEVVIASQSLSAFRRTGWGCSCAGVRSLIGVAVSTQPRFIRHVAACWPPPLPLLAGAAPKPT